MLLPCPGLVEHVLDFLQPCVCPLNVSPCWLSKVPRNVGLRWIHACRRGGQAVVMTHMKVQPRFIPVEEEL